MDAIDEQQLEVECPDEYFVQIAGKTNKSYAINPSFAYRYHPDFIQSEKTNEWNDVYDRTAYQIDRSILHKLRTGSKDGYTAMIEYLWLYIIQSNPIGHAGHVYCCGVEDLIGYLEFVCAKLYIQYIFIEYVMYMYCICVEYTLNIYIGWI